MKVCYVTMGFPLDAETFACTDLRALRRSGLDVSVHSMRRAPRDADTLLSERGLEGLVVEYATAIGCLIGLIYAVRHPWLSLQLVSWLVRSTLHQPYFLLVSLLLLPRALHILSRVVTTAPDVVHLFWGHYPSLVGYLVRRRLPGAVVSIFLGAYDLTYRYGPSGRVAREADVVWTHAEENRAALTELGVEPHRIAVAYRGVDLSLFHPPASSTPGLMASASRLCREKHVDDVLEICRRVREVRPEVSLVVMGDGPDRARLENMAGSYGLGDRVRFTGHVPQQVVRDELDRATFFLMMSREDTERLTNAVKEAMACRCLCVVASSPGLDELIDDGRNGFVVARGDTALAAQRILWASEHPDEADLLRDAAMQTIHDAFDVDRVMGAYRQRWASLCAAASARAGAARRQPAQEPVFERSDLTGAPPP